MGFVANFIRFPAAHKFWKSIKIWQSYREFAGGNFFETPCSIHTAYVTIEYYTDYALSAHELNSCSIALQRQHSTLTTLMNRRSVRNPNRRLDLYVTGFECHRRVGPIDMQVERSKTVLSLSLKLIEQWSAAILNFQRMLFWTLSGLCKLYLRPWASVAKQYNLVTAKQVKEPCLSGKVRKD